MFRYVRAVWHLKCKIAKMERFLYRKEKSQSSIFMFVVEMPIFSMKPQPAPVKGKCRQRGNHVDLERS